MEFLEAYFSKQTAAIPGGRYGFAQFLKLYGCDYLKNLSLGKLSYMVQLAIDDSILKYQRALLTLASKLESNMLIKTPQLFIIQKNILEILKENPNGLQLAQIPLLLKKKIDFQLDLTSLGFSKLKDFLATIHNVRIELNSANQPFAIYKPELNSYEIVSEISEIMKNDQDFNTIEHKLFLVFGYINWQIFKCDSIEDFFNQNFSKNITSPFVADNFPTFMTDQDFSSLEQDTSSNSGCLDHQLKFIYELLSDEDTDTSYHKSALDPSATPFIIKF